jgi:multiple sugar transport system substrate-binding protein
MTRTAIKIGALLTTAAVIGAGLTGCSKPASQGTDGTGATVELTFQQFDPAAQVTGLQAAIDNFNTSQTHIHVTMHNVAFADALNTFVREAGAGGGADVLHTAFTWTGDLAKNGLIVNLADFIAKSPPDSAADTFLGTDINSFKGSLYALPFTTDSFALTYNPKLLAAAGIDRPPADWETLSADAKKLTKNGVSGLCIPMGGAPGSEVWHIVNDYLWSHGSSVIKKEGNKWVPGSTDKQLADAITYFKGFLNDGSTPKNVLSIPLAGDPVIADGLSNGQCAMSAQVPPQFTVSLAKNDALRSATLPAGPDGLQLQLGGRSLSINAKSQHPNEAWEFIKYLTSKKVFQQYYTNQFPAQATLLKAREFGPTLVTEAYSGYTASLLVGKTYVEYLGAPMAIPAAWNALTEKFSAAYSGQLTPAEAAHQLNQKYISQLAGS